MLSTEIKETWYHLNPILLQQQVLDTPTYQKSKMWIENHMMLIEGFKKDINNSLKDIQKNTGKQLEAPKELQESINT